MYIDYVQFIFFIFVLSSEIQVLGLRSILHHKVYDSKHQWWEIQIPTYLALAQYFRCFTFIAYINSCLHALTVYLRELCFMNDVM